MRFDCHMHTPFCGHAVGEPEQYVRAAAVKGFHLLTFTCHIPMPSVAFGGPKVRMGLDQLDQYVAAIHRAADLGRSLGVEVLCGIEAEVFPDEEIMQAMDQILARHPFEFVLGSLHHQVPAYQQWLTAHALEEDDAIVEQYFEHLGQAAGSGRYHSLAHPDVIRLYGTVNTFEPARYETIIRRFLAAVVAADICLEVNTSGMIKACRQIHPDPVILGWAAEAGVRLTIGSDAHHPESIGQYFDQVVPQLLNRGFRELHYHRAGQRVAVPMNADSLLGGLGE